MPRIFDNIELHLHEDLIHNVKTSYRADFCVGYFNLRGWRLLAEHIDQYAGGPGQCCRLLVGMQRPAKKQVQDYYSVLDEKPVDNQTANRLRKEFREGLSGANRLRDPNRG